MSIKSTLSRQKKLAPGTTALYLQMQKRMVLVAAASLVAKLDEGTRASVAFAEQVYPPATRKEHTVWIKAGSVRYGPLFIDDYDLPRQQDGGQATMAEPALVAAPFLLQISPCGKTAYGDALVTRVPDVTGPKELFSQKYPALVVDLPAVAALRHVCARNNWHWRRTRNGKLLIGPLSNERPTKLSGIGPSDRPGGCRFEVTSPHWPHPGDAVETPFNDGIVIEVELRQQPGQGCRCFVTVGQARPLYYCEPIANRDLPAVVAKLDPFEVKINVARGGRTVQTPCCLMLPTADEGKCQIEWPVRIDDPGTLVVPIGGLSVELPKFYPEAAGKPVQHATLRADTWIGRFKKLERNADEADDSLASYTVKTRGIAIERMN